MSRLSEQEMQAKWARRKSPFLNALLGGPRIIADADEHGNEAQDKDGNTLWSVFVDDDVVLNAVTRVEANAYYRENFNPEYIGPNC